MGKNPHGLDSMVAFFPFVLGFHGTLHRPGRARSRQEMQASHASPACEMVAGGGEEERGRQWKVGLGKSTFGKEMAFGKNARI